jgi:hypothetical protein
LDLSSTSLNGTILRGANLVGTELDGADLTFVDLTDADLTGANLQNVSLGNAILSGADLTDANLMYAIFSFTKLDSTDLTCAILGFTQFNFCDTLHALVGLDTVNHVETTSLDSSTLKASIDGLSNAFLTGCGYSPEQIRELRTQYGSYYSCFLSYARLDSEFAKRLYNDLREHHVPCWRDESDSRSGQAWRTEINNALRSKEKVLFACSKNSIERKYVIEEIIATLRIEQETATSKLIPLYLDDYIFNEELDRIANDKTAQGMWSMNWVPLVREHQMGDFRNWKDERFYQDALTKLLRDLKHLHE